MTYLVMIVIGGFIGCLATMQQKEAELTSLRDTVFNLTDEIDKIRTERDKLQESSDYYLEHFIIASRVVNNTRRSIQLREEAAFERGHKTAIDLLV